MLTYVATLLLVLLLVILAVIVLKFHYVVPVVSVKNIVVKSVCTLLSRCSNLECVEALSRKIVIEGYCHGTVKHIRCVGDICQVDVLLRCRRSEENFSFACKLGRR